MSLSAGQRGERAASHAGMTQDRILPGILNMLAFCTLAPLLDVCSKLAAGGGVPVGEVTLARFLVQGALMLPVVAVLRTPLGLTRRALGFVFLRALFLMVSTFSFVAGIRVMPIADALAIAFVEPFVLLILGGLLYGDHVGPRRIAACAVGFAGALMVIQPSLTLFGPVALWPLGTAFFFAFYMLATRSISAFMNPVAMQFHTSWAGLAICLPVLALFRDGPVADLQLVMPQGWQWLWLFGVGFWAAVAHLFMTNALRLAPASTLAPLHYSEIVVAVILGLVIFDDLPNALAFSGIAVIVGSGLYIIHRERVHARMAREVLADPVSG